MTTAIYSNRLADKEKVERIYGWSEEGNKETEFRLRGGALFAVGYERIVYGDHGPYVEFHPWASQIRIELHNKFRGQEKPGIYYRWMYPNAHPNVKVYYQLRDVKHIANAPKRDDGLPSAFNRRKGEGYADYKPIMIYVSPYEFI